VEKSKSYVRSAEIMMRFSQDTLALHKQINIDAKEKQVKNMYIWLIVSVAVILILALLILTGVFYMRKRRLQSDFDLLQMRMENIRNRISPHFIFNVLNHEIDKQDEHTAKELMTMTHLIRDGLNISHKVYISLFEEIDFVKRYVYIENQILGENFVCHVDVPADDVLRRVFIPSMFIQILVENSIKHGLKMKQGIKRLSIKIDCTDISTVIKVSDNGIGFSTVRDMACSTRTGLNVIRQTILIVNARNSNKMRFNINNITDENQHIAGCMATLVIPAGIKL
jgi:LytS/YehU family sensor histidine kinase